MPVQEAYTADKKKIPEGYEVHENPFFIWKASKFLDQLVKSKIGRSRVITHNHQFIPFSLQSLKIQMQRHDLFWFLSTQSGLEGS